MREPRRNDRRMDPDSFSRAGASEKWHRYSLRVRLLASVADDGWSTRADTALSLCMWVCIGPCEKLVVASSCAWQIGNTGSDDGHKEAYKMLRERNILIDRVRAMALARGSCQLVSLFSLYAWESARSGKRTPPLEVCSCCSFVLCGVPSHVRPGRHTDGHLIFIYVISFVTKL